MREKTNAISPKRMGRPPLNLDLVQVRLSPDVKARIDAKVGKYGRAAYIREAVEEKLAREAD